MKKYSKILKPKSQLAAVRKLIKFYLQYPLKSIPDSYGDRVLERCPLCSTVGTKCNICVWIVIWGRKCIARPIFRYQQCRTRLHRLRVFEKVLKNQISKSKERKLKRK